MAGGASTVPAPGWAPAARAGVSWMQASWREASSPRPEGRGGRRGGTEGTEDTFLSTYIWYFREPVQCGGMVQRVMGGTPGGAGPGSVGGRPDGYGRGVRPERKKPPPAIPGDGGAPFLVGGHFRPRPDVSRRVPGWLRIPRCQPAGADESN